MSVTGSWSLRRRTTASLRRGREPLAGSSWFASHQHEDLSGVDLLVGDGLEHEAVHVEEERPVEALVVLREQLGLVDDLVTAILRPLEHSVNVRPRRNVKGDVLQPDAVA